MAIVATGQTTIIDFSDGKSLNAHLGTNTPKTQILDVNNAGGTYTPNWASSNVTITPFIYVNQQVIDPTDSAIGIEWKRREGVGSEAVLVSGETVQGDKSLKITQNKLGDSPSKLLTYIAKISYTDPDTAQTIHIEADITFSMVTTGENAKSAWISGDQVFKYAAGASTPTPASITLTANLQNVTMDKWQYKNSSGNWINFSPAQTSATINIAPESAAFNGGSTASIQLVTSDPNVGDTTSIYKVSDGATGQTGATPPSPSMAFLTNESITFAGNVSGQVAAVTVNSSVVAYTGATKVTPTVGTISGAPTGMTITKGSASSNEIPITITIAANSNLGSSGALSGELLVPITAPVATTLRLSWSKVNTGAKGSTGSAGADAKTVNIGATGQVFSSIDGGANYTPANITLTPTFQTVTFSKWQYSVDGGSTFTDAAGKNGITINGNVLAIASSSTLFTSAVPAIAFRVITSDLTVHDTVTVHKVSSGLSGLTAIVSNEAHTFPAAYNGAVSTYAGSGTTIRLFEGATELDYDGTGTANGKWKVSLTATGITAGSLTDSGNYLTVGQHSAMANATEAASISYNIIGKRATGGAINLTVMQTFTKAKQGNVGQNAVVLTIYSENGNTFENGAGADKTLKVNAYDGSTEITSGNATWKWTKLPSATSIGSGNTLTVQASDVTGMAVYKLEMTYPKTGGKKYYDTFTIVDKTDNYQAEIQSTGGNIFKNTQGNTILTCRVYQNGVEVDAPKSAIAQASNPSGGTSGQFYYKILTTGAIPRTTTLMKYTTSWGNAPGGDQHTLTYNWYRWDSEGTAMDGGAIWAVGKCVYAGPEDVDNKTTFYCEVNK